MPRCTISLVYAPPPLQRADARHVVRLTELRVLSVAAERSKKTEHGAFAGWFAFDPDQRRVSQRISIDMHPWLLPEQNASVDAIASHLGE
jgi:hypothetical protein